MTDQLTTTNGDTVKDFDTALTLKGRSADLSRVITLKECCELFGKSRMTVLMAIYSDRLVARKADTPIGERGGIYLISYLSARAMWGDNHDNSI